MPNYVTLYQNLPVCDREGLKMLQISVATHYRVGLSHGNHTALFKEILFIYEHFGKEWLTLVDNIMVSVVKDVAAEFKAFSFFRHRAAIGRRYQEAIRNALGNFNFEVTAGLILNINVPEHFDEAIKVTERVR